MSVETSTSLEGWEEEQPYTDLARPTQPTAGRRRDRGYCLRVSVCIASRELRDPHPLSPTSGLLLRKCARHERGSLPQTLF